MFLCACLYLYIFLFMCLIKFLSVFLKLSGKCVYFLQNISCFFLYGLSKTEDLDFDEIWFVFFFFYALCILTFLT